MRPQRDQAQEEPSGHHRLQEKGLLESRREGGWTVYTTTRKGAELAKINRFT